MIKTAILVDGGFYRHRANAVWGNKTPEERADELMQCCNRHLQSRIERIKYYLIFPTS